MIAAAGSRLAPLDLAGEGLPVEPAYAVLLSDVRPPMGTKEQPIVIFGGGETGAETAEYLAAEGHNVLLVTRSGIDQIARNAEPLYRMHLLRRLAANTALTMIDHTRVVGVAPGEVTLAGPDGELRRHPASCLLLAHGLAPAKAVADSLADACPVVVSIGDANLVARIGEAVHDAYRAVQNLQRVLNREELLAC